MNASRISNSGRDANVNVLSERVTRISEKINEIHVYLQKLLYIYMFYSVILKKEKWES